MSAESYRMTACLLLLFILACCLPTNVDPVVAESSQTPLDLPTGGGGDEDDDEDAPETVVFYGGEYEGDAFCWALDRSGSMMWDGRWPVLQEELASAVNSLSSLADFGIVFWSDNAILWQQQSRRALPINKAMALSWAAAITPSGSTCVIEGVLRSLQLNRTSQRRKKVILLLSDGEPFCNFESNAEDAIQVINGANFDGQTINCIGVNVGSGGSVFLQQLATSNGGTYAHVE